MKMHIPSVLPRTEEARTLLVHSLRLCAVMLLCSWMLLVFSGGIAPDTYRLCRLSGALETEACGILLLGNLGALLEEVLRQ